MTERGGGPWASPGLRRFRQNDHGKYRGMMTLRDGLRAFFLFVALAWAPIAAAGPFEDAVPKFSADSYSDTETATAAIAASGHPLAMPVIEALRDGRLLAGGGRV